MDLAAPYAHSSGRGGRGHFGQEDHGDRRGRSESDAAEDSGDVQHR